MESKILFINACVRTDSRTKELTRHLLDSLVGKITEVNLYRENITPLDAEGLDRRNTHDYFHDEFKYAKQSKDADIIVIAAPYWDLSFPSVLKIYFEKVTVSGITFEYSKEGRPFGKCNAKKLYYITTSGGYIGENNFGFEYIKALAENFFGIGETYFYSAEGLDIFGTDAEVCMNEAKKHISNSI